MNTMIDMQAMRRQLLNRRAEILEGRLRRQRELLAGTWNDSMGAGREVGDYAAAIHQDSVNIIQLQAMTRSLNQVEEALGKLNSGNFGICRECQDFIDERRLLMLPTATCCKTCQEYFEVNS